MKFIEIAPGKSIRADDISAIEAKGMKSILKVGSRLITIDYPYKTIMAMLNKEDRNLTEVNDKIGKLPIFAG